MRKSSLDLWIFVGGEYLLFKLAQFAQRLLLKPRWLGLGTFPNSVFLSDHWGQICPLVLLYFVLSRYWRMEWDGIQVFPLRAEQKQQEVRIVCGIAFKRHISKKEVLLQKDKSMVG